MTIASSETPSARLPSAAGGWLKRLAPLVGLVCVTAFFAVLRPYTFPTLDNVQLMLTQTAVVGTAALGMTIVIISGGIDLSVGSEIGLCTVVIALLLNAGVSPAVAALGGIAAVVLCGLVVGGLVAGARLLPFIVTLGALGALRGLAKLLATNGRVPAPETWLNDLLDTFGSRRILLPPGVWLMLLLAICVSGLLRYTRFGRHVFAIGSNEQTARLCGVRVDRTKVLVYALGAVFTGIAGVLQFSYLTSGDATTAPGYELNVIAAVVIGGASLTGGEGTVLGSLVGAMLMTVIANGCTKLGLRPAVQEVVTGVIIVLAALLDRLRRRAT
jgi:ribose/xylose/arabinose/galactoside ABC-type transport system permease subunit